MASVLITEALTPVVEATLPLTSKLFVGPVVPIPTFPFEATNNPLVDPEPLNQAVP